MRFNAWSLYWCIWLFVMFGVPEGIALATNHPENTLSENVWRLEGSGASFFRYMVAAMLLWLLLHMVFRIFK